MLNSIVTFLSSNVVRFLSTLIIIIPITTFYLTKEEIGFISFSTIIYTCLVNVLNTSGNLLINTYFHKVPKYKFEIIYSHIFYCEVIINY